jgi:hypothetical protein
LVGKETSTLIVGIAARIVLKIQDFRHRYMPGRRDSSLADADQKVLAASANVAPSLKPWKGGAANFHHQVSILQAGINQPRLLTGGNLDYAVRPAAGGVVP